MCVEPKSFAESITLVSPGAAVTHRDGSVFVVLPVPYVPPSGGPPAELVLRHVANRSRVVSVPALVEPGVPGRYPGQLVAKVAVRRFAGEGHIGPGVWAPRLRVDGKESDLRFVLEMAEGAGCASRPAPSPASSFPSARRRPGSPPACPAAGTCCAWPAPSSSATFPATPEE